MPTMSTPPMPCELLSEFGKSVAVDPPEELLASLAARYGAEGAGLAGPVDAYCPVQLAFWEGAAPQDIAWPWHDRPLLERLRVSFKGETARRADRQWLLADLGEGRVLVWVAVDLCRRFSEEEAAFLPLAGWGILRKLRCTAPTHPLCKALEQSRRGDELERSARFAGKLAHDIGNQLTGILGFADLARSQTPTGLARQYLDEVVQSARQGAAWVQKLQVFSRRGAAPQGACSIAAVVAGETERLRALGSAGFQASVPDGLPSVPVDAQTLRRVIAELLDNALESTEGRERPTLSIQATTLGEERCAGLLGQPAPGAFLEIRVADAGPGLPDALRAGRLDDAFVASRRRHRGLGLLAVYGIAIGHQGGIALETAPKGGAAVSVFLPIRASSRRPEAGG